MRERRWLLLTLFGLLLVITISDAAKGSRTKFKIATSTTTTTTTEQTSVEDENSDASSDDDSEETATLTADTNSTSGHNLTGIPQIDYKFDPNLPRELNGYDLSEYPFYNSVPADIDFKCDGLHDGFYASVPHKCQVYHHCLYGTRYDFLCANFTAFDQKTFICHFVSEVDCANSKKYWHRNDALYQSASSTTTSTTTTSTTSTTTTSAPPASSGSVAQIPERPLLQRERGEAPLASPARRRRPPMRRPPVYDYYDDEYYDDDYDRVRYRGYNRGRDYEDYEVLPERKYRPRDRDRDYRHRLDYRGRERELTMSDRFTGRGNRGRDPQITRLKDQTDEDVRPITRNKDQDSSRTRDIEDRVRDGDERRFKEDYEEKQPVQVSSSTEGLLKPAVPIASVFARPRTPPKFRRPVPLSEQVKYTTSTTTSSTTPVPIGESRRRPTTEAPVDEEDYYVDELEEVRPRWQMRGRPFRERDRDYHDKRYNRDRDRLYRTRYQEEEEEVRPRKTQERTRSRYHDRSRDREPEQRGRDRLIERPKDRTPSRTYDSERLERPSLSARPLDRDRDNERPRLPSRVKDHHGITEAPKKIMSYERTTTTKEPSASPATVSTTTEEYLKEKFTTAQPEEPKHRINKFTFMTNHPKTETQQKFFSGHYIKAPETTTTTTTTPSTTTVEDFPDKTWRTSSRLENQSQEKEEAPIDYMTEYYDEEDEPVIVPVTSPRSTVRTIKRPFLPSRGGNPNPRGLLPVGSKALNSPKKDDVSPSIFRQYPKVETTTAVEEVEEEGIGKVDLQDEYHESKEQIQDKNVNRNNNKQTYNTYKTVQPAVVLQKHYQQNYQRQKIQNEYKPQTEEPIIRHQLQNTQYNQHQQQNQQVQQYELQEQLNQNQQIHQEQPQNYHNQEQQQPEQIPQHYQTQQQHQQQPHHVNNYDITITKPVLNQPEPEIIKKQPETYQLSIAAEKTPHTWTTEFQIHEQNNDANIANNQQNLRTNNRQPQTEAVNLYTNAYKNNDEQDIDSIGNLRAKQKINEVTHHSLQDIPESEYDVTLNEALTPNLNQESNLPSGFVLPIHRQLGRDSIIQSSENSFKYSVPVSTPQQQPQQTQQLQPQYQRLTQQKPFVQNQHYVSNTAGIVRNNNDRGKMVYYRTPETIQISGSQHRTQRGQWTDYAGF